MEKTPNVKTINNVSTFTNPTLKPAGKLSILTKNTTRNNFHPCCGGASYDFTCKAEKNICAPIIIKIKPPVSSVINVTFSETYWPIIIPRNGKIICNPPITKPILAIRFKRRFCIPKLKLTEKASILKANAITHTDIITLICSIYMETYLLLLVQSMQG